MSVAVARRALVMSRPLRVVLALGKREGLRLLRHPIFLSGLVMSLALFGLLTWHNAPVLHRDDTHTPGALLPLALATLIVANLAAIRAARDGTDELYEGLPTEAVARTAGHLLSLVWAVGASIAAIVVMLAYLLIDGPVGTPRVVELAAGPTVVFIFGAIGIALAQWKKHVAIAPVAAVALIALQVLLVQPIVGLRTGPSRMPWFAPWAPLSLTSDVPPELVIRPSGWHLIYLVGVAVLFIAFALIRHRARARLVPVLVVGALLVGAGSFGQTRPVSAGEVEVLTALLERPEDFQVCRVIDHNTYCAYPAYERWIDRWAAAIGGVLEEVPPEDRPRGLVIQQGFGSYFEGWVDVPAKAARRADRRPSSADIEVGFQWGRGSSEGQHEFGIIMPVVTRVLGLPVGKDDIRLTREDVERIKENLLPRAGKQRRKWLERRLVVGGTWDSCHTLGQARAAVGFWLASQATAATRHSAELTATEYPYGLRLYEEQKHYYYTGPYSPLYGITFGNADYSVSWSDAEFHYAVQLLSRDDEEVGREIRARWEELTEPATPTIEVIETFDLEPVPTIEEQIAAAPAGYTRAPGDRTRFPEDFLKGTPPCR